MKILKWGKIECKSVIINIVLVKGDNLFLKLRGKKLKNIIIVVERVLIK